MMDNEVVSDDAATLDEQVAVQLNEAKMLNEAMSKQRIRDLEDQKTYMADLIKVLTEDIDSHCSYTGQLVEEVERLERENERLEEANQRIALPPNAMEDDDRET
jgi:hypothetical protein